MRERKSLNKLIKSVYISILIIILFSTVSQASVVLCDVNANSFADAYGVGKVTSLDGRSILKIAVGGV